jgi:hypothetical protein
MAKPISHAERVAALESAKERAVSDHAVKIARLDDQRRAANETKTATLAALEADHEATHSAACIASQRACAEGFAEVVKAFSEAPSRATATALASRFRELEQAAIHSTGAPLGRELGFAFVAELLRSNPAALPRFGMASAFNSDVLGCLEHIEAANQACRMVGASSAPVVQQALETLERQIARIAEAREAAPEATAAARFEALRFSGSHSAAQKAISAIEAKERAPVEAEAFENFRRHSKGWGVLRAVSGLIEPMFSDDERAARAGGK